MSTAPAIVHSRREQWLLGRREWLPDGPVLTASDIAAILGEDEHRGPLAVALVKRGDVVEETLPMRRGRRFERAIGEEYAEQTGRPVDPWPVYELVTHPDIPWLKATPDALTSGCPGKPDPLGGTVAESREGRVVGSAPLQIKMAIGSAKEWRDEPPLGYVMQTNVEMACLRSSWGALAGLVGPGPLSESDLVRDDQFFAAMLPHLEAFRALLARGELPEADGKPGTSEAIRRFWANDNGETVALEALDLQLVEAWEKCGVEEAAAKVAGDVLENMLRRRLGPATFGALTDGTFLSLRKTRRAGYSVEPCEYRVLKRFRPRLRRRR